MNNFSKSLSEKKEVSIIFEYLQGNAVFNPLVNKLYSAAIDKPSNTISARDAKLLNMVQHHPWTLKFIDSGLAIIYPSSEVRRRVFIMISILESMPEYSEDFLPKERSIWYVAAVSYSIFSALVKALLGSIIILVVRG